MEELKKLIKFGFTGVMNTLLDFGVYSLLAVVLGWNVYLSQFLGYSTGMLNSYLVNRSWTFGTKERFLSPQLVKFLITNLVILALSMLLLKFFIGSLGLHKLVAKLAATCITLVLNFIISRLWVFHS